MHDALLIVGILLVINVILIRIYKRIQYNKKIDYLIIKGYRRYECYSGYEDNYEIYFKKGIIRITEQDIKRLSFKKLKELYL